MLCCSFDLVALLMHPGHVHDDFGYLHSPDFLVCRASMLHLVVSHLGHVHSDGCRDSVVDFVVDKWLQTYVASVAHVDRAIVAKM